MPDFAINLSTTFRQVPLVQRFEAVARAGFEAVEVSFPHAMAPHELARRLRDHRLLLLAFNLPAGDWERGERGIACSPDRVSEFRDGTRHAIHYAGAVGCRFLNCLAGPLPKGVSSAEAKDTLLENLRFATGLALAAGIRILLEPIDLWTLPHSALHDTWQGVALLDALGARNAALLYNVSHMQAAGEAVELMIARHLPRIGHIHASGWLDHTAADRTRSEFEALYARIDGIGHHGWIGCGSAASVEAGSLWMSRQGRRNPRCRWGIPVSAFRS